MDAGQILRMRALASAMGPTTGDSPTNKIPQDWKPCAEANPGGGAGEFQANSQDCPDDPWAG